MKSCKQCGTELPESARFCLHCGSPVTDDEPEQPEGPQQFQQRQILPPEPALDFVQPALAGGMFLGFLSSLPFIAAGNMFCCMWVLLGGGIATIMLMSQRRSGSISYGDGAFVGVLSGLFGAVVGTVVQMASHAIFSRLFENQQQDLEQILDKLGSTGPIRDFVLRAASGEISTTTVLFTFFSNLLAFSLFAMIGGILTVALINRRKRQGAGRIPRPPAN